MTQAMDLMPESCRRRIGRKRRMRRWIGGYIAAALVFACAVTALRVQARGLGEEVAQLKELVDLDANQRREADALGVRIADARLQLDRQSRLSLPVRVGDVISIIGRQMPESVSLTSLAFTPRVEKTSARQRTAPSAKPSQGEEPQRRLMIEVEGIAPNDIDMSVFVAGLEACPLFRHVAVDFARKAVIRTVEGREFALTCEVDLGRRYEFEPAGTQASGATAGEEER